MKLFGIYEHVKIENLEFNHRKFCDINNIQYKKYFVKNYYQRYLLILHLIQENPGEILFFIDGKSFFKCNEIDFNLPEDILLFYKDGKVLTNFFVVRSCVETEQIFYQIKLQAAKSYIVDRKMDFSIEDIPQDRLKNYPYKQKDIYLNIDIKSHSNALDIKNILVLFFDDGWANDFYPWAEILCHHQKRERTPSHGDFEVVNPFQKKAILTLSTPEIADYSAISEENFKQYALQNGLTLYLYRNVPEEFAGIHANWTKPYLIDRHLVDHESLSWVDSDILFTKNYKIPYSNLISLYNDVGMWKFNTGFMTFANAEPVRNYLRAVIKRCEALNDRSSLYVNDSDQGQFINELPSHFPKYVPKSNLITNVSPAFDFFHSKEKLIHFMGIHPSVRALIMDYFQEKIWLTNP
jgi:hypothetical protein